ncbi:hypothetical protein BRADI_1g35612v3 [Brachypodium distachyon]|uniref:Uncharacterized protein n=1 Tax=Brachypodium distachyon TaxID=15368 RepID=A0A2K2DMV2_BRADI|nr:hypothetical protein BRADI_1g35612v3 [Brachypodium distachyon]
MERLELCRDEEQARLCWLNLLKGTGMFLYL